MHLNIERITLHGHDKNWYVRLVLTFHRLRAEDGRSCGVFHTVGTESGRSLRLEPSMWIILLKHLSSKCSEQTMNLPCAVKFARWVLTTLTHLSRSTLFTGLQCSDIPAWWSEELLYPWTTHRLPGMIQLKTYEHNIILREVFSRHFHRAALGLGPNEQEHDRVMADTKYRDIQSKNDVFPWSY